MFQRVLVPLDGSELAEQAVSYAAGMAEKFAVPLQLLHAFEGLDKARYTFATTEGELDRRVWQRSGSSEDMTTAIREYLDQQAQMLSVRGLSVNTVVVDVVSGGSAAGAILAEAERAPGTVVVMATHGRGGLGRLIFGSTANEVLQKATVPILLIRIVGGNDAAAGATSP